MILSALISNARSTVGHIDNSASYEALLLQNMLHDAVIGMSICPKMDSLTGTPADASLSHSRTSAPGSQPVNHSIRFLIGPGAVLNVSIGGIFTQNKAKKYR